MAILKNKKNNIYIELKLKVINESPAWLSYSLQVLTVQNSITNHFFKLYDEEKTLYFENEIEPEVPILCTLIQDVILDKKQKIIFEPVDEKDFSLKIERYNNSYTVDLFADHTIILESFDWDFYPCVGIKIYATENDLINFMNELKTEYKNLYSQESIKLIGLNKDKN